MTVFFPDVSHYQSGLSLTGAPAVIAKATEGTGFRDPAYAGFKAQAASLGIPFAGYHWVNTEDLAAQAANAYTVLGDTPTMWDAEAAGSTVPRLVDLTRRFRALGGNPRLVYLPHWWWQDHLGSPDLRPLADVGLALVSSHYTTYSDTGPGWASYGGVTPTVWQYTNSQAFNGQRVDFNAYKGTVDDFRRLLTGDTMELYDKLSNGYSINNALVTLLARTPTDLSARLDALDAKVDTALTALGAIGSSNPDVAAVLTGLEPRLAELRAQIEADTRDAIADEAEGGAAAVRANS